MSTYDSEYQRGINNAQSGVGYSPPAQPAVQPAYKDGFAKGSEKSSDKGGKSSS
jgi:hypothetical protein